VNVSAPEVTAQVDSGGFEAADDQQLIPPLASPSLLPATGFRGAASGDLRSQVRQALGIPEELAPTTEPPFTITPSLALTQEYTDAGSYSTSGKAQPSFISILEPSVAMQGATRRLQVNLNYAPEAYVYESGGGQSYVGQNFNGRALVTLVPQTLFVDLRAFGTTQSVFGGFGPNAVGTAPTSGVEQNYSFSISPYLVHRFGSFGTGELGYAFARTLQSGINTTSALLTPSPFGLLPQTAAASFASQDVTTQNVHAAFVTGENFYRYNGTVLATASQYSGGGVLSDAYRNVFSIDNGYAITRTITALGRIGYEDIKYSGTDPQHVSDVLWDVGVRLRPGPDTTITARYGHHDGLNSLLLDATLAPSSRTRVYVSYSGGLTTEGEELQNVLANADLDDTGNLVDHTTGAPLLASSNFFGTEDNLYRLHRLSISGAYMLDRDTFTAELDSSDYKLVSSSGLGNGFGSNSGTYGSLSWAHDWNPRLQSTAFIQYGIRSLSQQPVTGGVLPASTSGSAPDLTTAASMTYEIGKGFTGTVEYSYERSSVVGPGQSQSQNTILLTVAKTF
jgi:uncharacterized protein (PEP-CTERM system associated)